MQKGSGKALYLDDPVPALDFSKSLFDSIETHSGISVSYRLASEVMTLA